MRVSGCGRLPKQRGSPRLCTRASCCWPRLNARKSAISAAGSRPRALSSGANATVKARAPSKDSVARRGDVLAVKRRLGFGARGLTEHFVVLQSDDLRGLETLIVAPLDVDGPLYEDDPLVVHVEAKEAGAKRPHVVLVHMLSAALVERFEAGQVGKLSARSMASVDALVRVVLHLP